jgi:hypothetical protein
MFTSRCFHLDYSRVKGTSSKVAGGERAVILLGIESSLSLNLRLEGNFLSDSLLFVC